MWFDADGNVDFNERDAAIWTDRIKKAGRGIAGLFGGSARAYGAAKRKRQENAKKNQKPVEKKVDYQKFWDNVKKDDPVKDRQADLSKMAALMARKRAAEKAAWAKTDTVIIDDVGVVEKPLLESKAKSGRGRQRVRGRGGRSR